MGGPFRSTVRTATPPSWARSPERQPGRVEVQPVEERVTGREGVAEEQLDRRHVALTTAIWRPSYQAVAAAAPPAAPARDLLSLAAGRRDGGGGEPGSSSAG